MKLEIALNCIVESLKNDVLVEAIYLKGSIARKEHDEFSDIDIYCLVKTENVERFLPNRLQHLESYQKLVFKDDIYIVAPQLLAVYEDMLHVDLYTVTLETMINKDAMEVLYDPKHILNSIDHKANLKLEKNEFQDSADDMIWFLYQYYMTNLRGNHLWAIHLLHQVLTHLSKVLLHKYAPNRAQLGLKTLSSSLPPTINEEFEMIYSKLHVDTHRIACLQILHIIEREENWLFENVPEPLKIRSFWEKVKGLIKNSNE